MAAPIDRPLKILAPTRYPWRFNSPRDSRHAITNRNFLALNKLSAKIEGITVLNPFPLESFDLVHAFNRIPLGTKPFLIGFESHLPRGFGIEHTAYFRWMCHILAGERCRGIIAISDYAKRQVLKQHQGKPWVAALESKLIVRYPNIPIPDIADSISLEPSAPIRMVFVGNHFARKGGCVVIELAEMAQAAGIDLQIEIVSAGEVGRCSWVDPTRQGYFDDYLARLKQLPSVRLHAGLPNHAVIEVVRHSHFLLLPTLSDSFGYSTIEAMANHTPCIATAQAALREFIADNQNGWLLPLEVDDVGEWVHINMDHDRSSTEYEQIFTRTNRALAEDILRRLAALKQDPMPYAAMRKAARATAESLFSASAANEFWDSYYIGAAAN